MTTQTTPDFAFLGDPERAGDLGKLGHYHVVELLGKGGMGHVFHAEDDRLKRSVALKVMNQKFAATANSRDRFLEEARVMAAVHHDNVATIFDVGEHKGTPFIAMELLRGQTLSEAVANGSCSSTGEIISVGKQVAQGLAAVHMAGIVHRDVKPANIWIQQPGNRVKLLDFGLALGAMGLDQLTASGNVLGTPGYLSPEQARNEAVDDRTDLYSLGVVLYEMGAGELPLRASTLIGQLIAIIAHEPPSLRERKPEIPTPLTDLIEQLLAKEPRDRIGSAREFVRLLDNVAESWQAEHAATVPLIQVDDLKTHESGRTAPPENAMKMSRRPFAWFGAAAVLLLISTIAWWFAAGSHHDSSSLASSRDERDPEPKPVMASSLMPLRLTDVVGATGGVVRGDAARFRVSLTNTAKGPASDPKRLNAKAEVASQLVCYLKPPDQIRRPAPAYPKRLTPAQLPAPGETKEVEVHILTQSLAVGSTVIRFELQSPAGGRVASISAPLTVAENLREGDLIDFQYLRTHAGDGADTYLRKGDEKNVGSQPFVQVHRRGNKLTQHAYLRFDLSKAPFPIAKLDRAVLLLTLHDGSLPNSTINAYGVPLDQQPSWDDAGEDELLFEQSPSNAGIGALTFLGQAKVHFAGKKAKQRTDGVRIVGGNLDDYLREVGDKSAVIVLVRENHGNKPTRFHAKEGKPGKAPALALRKVASPASEAEQ